MNRQSDAVIDRALSAKTRLAQLRSSKTFQRRYAEGDPAAIDAFNELVSRYATGREIAEAEIATAEAQRYGVPLAPDVNRQSEAWQARQQAVEGLINSPEFQKKYKAGDPDALRQWRELSEGAATMLGVDASEASPAPAPAPEIGGGAA
ncbi:hypothetical protein [Dongia sp. agr-C8]